jgi:hypothetical protein
MKKTLCAILTAGALACALSLPVASQDKDDMKAMQAGKAEKHPEIRAAIHHLEEAKNNLQHAAHDFGGHRAKALEHVNQALAECNEALNFDKK